MVDVVNKGMQLTRARSPLAALAPARWNGSRYGQLSTGTKVE